MLPGSAIADRLFAAPLAEGKAGARAGSGDAAQAGSFAALLGGETQQQQQQRTAKPGMQTQGTPSEEAASPDAVTANEPAPDPANAGKPLLVDASAGQSDIPRVDALADGEAEAGRVQPVQTTLPAPGLPVSDTLEPDGAPHAAKDGEKDPDGIPATGFPESPPPAPKADAQPASPKAEPGQQPPVPAMPPASPAAQPAPELTEATPQQADLRAADAAAAPARTAGEVPATPLVQREMQREAGRAATGEAVHTSDAKESAGKSAAAPKDTGAGGRASAAAAATPAATGAPATLPAPQTLPAMLVALQSAARGAEALDPALTSEGGEIRSETSASLPVRSESTAMQAMRTSALTPGLRMTPGHAAELGQVIARRFASGARSFDIRLDPPELGRVQVRLEIGADRSVQAMLTADKPEALAELQRHARELARALAEAGLDLGENALGFALNEGGEDADGGQEPGEHAGTPADTRTLSISDASTLAPASRYGFMLAGRAGVDMRI